MAIYPTTIIARKESVERKINKAKLEEYQDEEIVELNQTMDSTDEILDSLVKKNTEMEKQVAKITEHPVPDYSIAINNILTEVREIKQNFKQSEELALLKQIYEKLNKVPTFITKQVRILLFPETNRGQCYKIVFGRLIPRGSPKFLKKLSTPLPVSSAVFGAIFATASKHNNHFITAYHSVFLSAMPLAIVALLLAMIMKEKALSETTREIAEGKIEVPEY